LKSLNNLQTLSTRLAPRARRPIQHVRIT